MAEFNFQTTDRLISESLGEVYSGDYELFQPNEFYHYCSLPVCGSILEGNIWLSHAEFSNDEEEIALGRKLIEGRILSHHILRADPTFQRLLVNEFEKLSAILEVYIWCFSAFPSNPPEDEADKYTDEHGVVHSLIAKSAGPQDRLGQWRAYGADGKGACLTISRSSINKLVSLPLRVNAVIYDQVLALGLVDAVISRGHGVSNAPATAAALVFLLPIIKHPGFGEEREWRLLYAQSKFAAPKPNFHISGDLHSPHHTLRDVLQSDPSISRSSKVQNTVKGNPFLMDITEIMIGPSKHKDLNSRSMQMKADAVGRGSIPITQSAIPYRS